jgi:hypothetical protein
MTLTLTMSKTFFLLQLILFFIGAFGFGPHIQVTHQRRGHSQSSSALYKAISEQDATYLLAKAQECAFSDSATMEDAKQYLRELLHIQSGCVVGTIAGRDLCDNQELYADIVARLQAKVDNQSQGSKMRKEP